MFQVQLTRFPAGLAVTLRTLVFCIAISFSSADGALAQSGPTQLSVTSLTEEAWSVGATGDHTSWRPGVFVYYTPTPELT